jgi:hypothetical protein
MRAEERRKLYAMHRGNRFRLMFGLRPIPEYPMPLTQIQREDIQSEALAFHRRPLTTFHGLVDFVIDRYELVHSPSQMEVTNHALGLEIERLKEEVNHLRDDLNTRRTPPTH